MNPKIMVVDDALLIRTMVKRALSAEFDVVEAQDGVDALAKAAEHGDIRLVICDVNMPRMGGLEFLEQIRTEDRYKAIPVIMLTTETRADLIERARELNAQWLVKPFKAPLVLAAARALLSTAA